MYQSINHNEYIVCPNTLCTSRYSFGDLFFITENDYLIHEFKWNLNRGYCD